VQFDLGRRHDRALQPQVDLGQHATGRAAVVNKAHHAGHLGEGFADQHAGHDGVAGEVAGEERLVAGGRPAAHPADAGVE